MNKILCWNCCQGKLTKEKIRRPQAQQKNQQEIRHFQLFELFQRFRF